MNEDYRKFDRWSSIAKPTELEPPQNEYRKQLSAYDHVLTEVYPDRDIRIHIYYTDDGEQVSLDPIPGKN